MVCDLHYIFMILIKDLGKCICQKNTEGYNCQKCKPMYNNKPWTFGQPCEGNKNFKS